MIAYCVGHLATVDIFVLSMLAATMFSSTTDRLPSGAPILSFRSS